MNNCRKSLKCLYLSIILATTQITGATSEILVAKSAEEVLIQLNSYPKNTLIFIDVDDTLITPTSTTFRSAPSSKIIDQIKQNQDSYPNYSEILSNWRLQRKVTLLDPNWPAALSKLKQKHKVYGLTKMSAGTLGNIKSMEEWRYQELESMNLSFSRDNDLPHLSDSESVFHKGILFTGNKTKSRTIELFFQNLKQETIALIDDRLSHLEDVKKFCDSHSISFIGIHYQGLQTLEGTPNSEIVELQKKHLTEKTEWLEDEEAIAILKNEKRT